MNKTILIGRVSNEITLRYTQSGIAVANFNLAVNRRFAKEGEQQADFINILAWGKTAEIMSEHLHKGSLIGIVGRIQTGKYNDKDGRTVYTTEVVVEEFEFLESRKKDATDEAKKVFPEAELVEGELPF